MLHRRIAIGVSTDISYTSADEVQNRVALPQTGGTVIALTPQLLLSLRTDWLLRAAVQIPTVQWWSAAQTDRPIGIVALIVDL